MTTLFKLTGASLLVLSLLAAGACGDDEKNGGKPPAGDGDGDGDGNGDGDGTGDGDGDGDGTGDGDGDECDLGWEGKEEAVVPNPTGNLTLTSDKVWLLEGLTYVADGQTLTIEPCTRVEGDPSGSPTSALIVSRGGKLMAKGEADKPILFTSTVSRDERKPGNWGGVVLLGRAPNNKGQNVLIEGLTDAPENQHGGSAADDNSGVMTYVRIEDAGYAVSDGNELNGLTMGSVGSGTEIHHVMMVNGQDDCFEWFGGTVNAHHLICDAPGDDMFDVDMGYTGTLHTLLGRQRQGALSSSDPNGWETDSSSAGPSATPRTHFTGQKVTLCDNVILGFADGVSLRDPFGTPAEPSVTIANSKFFLNTVNNVGKPRDAEESNPEPIDPVMWFEMGAGNEVPDPAPFTLADCQADGGPNEKVTGSGIGAFKDEADWATGKWVEWSTLAFQN
jgi:hypothetical protein